jgi:hypothetical protein
MTIIKERVREINSSEFSNDVMKSTIVRFSYLYPNDKVLIQKDKIFIEGEETTLPERMQEFFYLLYRQKIYQETLAIRNKIYESI